jgi:hypothetical protein
MRVWMMKLKSFTLVSLNGSEKTSSSSGQKTKGRLKAMLKTWLKHVDPQNYVIYTDEDNSSLPNAVNVGGGNNNISPYHPTSQIITFSNPIIFCFFTLTCFYFIE